MSLRSSLHSEPDDPAETTAGRGTIGALDSTQMMSWTTWRPNFSDSQMSLKSTQTRTDDALGFAAMNAIVNAESIDSRRLSEAPAFPQYSRPSSPHVRINMDQEIFSGERIRVEHSGWSPTPKSQDQKPITWKGSRPDLKRQAKDDHFFGMRKCQSDLTGGTGGNRSYNYEEKYTSDEPGEETGENARVWKVYLDEAEIYDDDMVKGFRDNTDALLVFAALFSAVVTTFVVETSDAFQPDNSQILFMLAEQVQILRANGNATTISSIPSSLAGPTYATTDVLVNGLFFTSLALSLSTALLSVLVKQLVQAYSSVSSGTARSRALVRQFRYSGLVRWKLPEIVGLLL